MFDSIKRLLAAMVVKSYAFLVPPGEAGLEQFTTLNSFTASEEGYKRVVWVYRCVNEVAKRVSSVPFKAYKMRGGKRVEITGKHPLNSFLEKPNKKQGWASFIKNHMIFLMVSGNSYWDISTRIGNMPVGVYTLRPDRITIVPTESPDERVRNYNYTYGSQKTPINRRDIVHFSYFDPTNDYFGLSPIQVAGNVIDTENDAITYNKYMMRNQARPSGVLQTEQKLQGEPFKRLTEAIQSWMGNKNAGKPILLEAGLKWVQNQLSQKDSDYVNLRKLNREEICAVLGVPPIIAGILDRATYSNYQEGDTMIWGQTCTPELRLFRDDFNVSVAPLFEDDSFIDYDLSNVEALKEHQDSIHKRAREDYLGGVITLNQAKKLIGEEEMPGCHFYLLPNSMSRVFISEEAQAEAMKPENTSPPPSPILPGLLPPQAGQDEPDGDSKPPKEIPGQEKPQKAPPKPKGEESGNVEAELEPANAKKGKSLDMDEFLELKALALEGKYVKLVAKAEKKIGKAVSRYFDKQQIEVEKNVRKGQVEEPFDVEAWDEAAITHIKPTIQDTYHAAGNHGAAEVESHFNPLDSSALRFSDNHLMAHWGQIGSVNHTTFQALQTALQEGLQNQDDTNALLNKVQAVYDLARESRINAIAISEANYAINMGLLQAYNQAGAKKGIRKWWESRDDGKVRETHVIAHHTYSRDKAIKLFETFKVGEGRCLCPGHTGIASEDINCRCRVKAVVYKR